MQIKLVFKKYLPLNSANHKKIVRKRKIFGNCKFFMDLKYERIYIHNITNSLIEKFY